MLVYEKTIILSLARMATKKKPLLITREIMRSKDAQCNTKESPHKKEKKRRPNKAWKVQIREPKIN